MHSGRPRMTDVGAAPHRLQTGPTFPIWLYAIFPFILQGYMGHNMSKIAMAEKNGQPQNCVHFRTFNPVLSGYFLGIIRYGPMGPCQ